MRSILLFSLGFLLLPPIHAWNGGLINQNTIGGAGIDKVYDYAVTPDNGSLLVGSTTSFDVDEEDVYVVKLDQKGNLVWNKTYGGWESDRGYAITRTRDNYYVITGAAVEKTGIGDDVLFLRINGDGGVVSEKHYGGNAWDWGSDIVELSDGKILIGGITEQFWTHTYDPYMVKVEAKGDLIWKRRVPVDGDFQFGAMLETQEGNVLVVGTVTDTLGLDSDIIVLNVDQNGKQVWNRTYGGDGKEFGHDLLDTGDGYLVLCKGETTAENEFDTSLLKIDYEGDFIWSKSIGYLKDDFCNKIINTGLDEYALIGTTYNTVGNGADMLLVKVDSTGNVLLTERYGTSGWDSGRLVHRQGDKMMIIGETDAPRNNILVMMMSTSINSLELSSEYGTPSGSGEYFNGSSVEISIPEIVNLDSKVRYVFTGWSDQNGTIWYDSANAVVDVDTNITLSAQWQKEYYVEIVESDNVSVDPSSGWYVEESNLWLKATPSEGKTFTGWTGAGPGSYSGSDRMEWIKVLGPIIQTPNVFELAYSSLDLVSKYGVVTGDGQYQTGSVVEFSVEPTIIEVDDWTRMVFKGWESVYENGYNGVESTASLVLSGHLVETAVWHRQFYVNTSLHGGGWVDEGSDLTLTCVLGSGEVLDEWETVGVDDYTETGDTITFTVTGPARVTASTIQPEKCFLRIDSEHGEITGTSNSYVGAMVSFSVYPEIIDTGENSRVVFDGWKCISGQGYWGEDNPVSMKLKGDAVQEAIWVQQFYIQSEEDGINGWYDENTSIALDPQTEGSFISKHLRFNNDSETIGDEFKVTGPMTISSDWSYSVTNLVLAALTSSSIGYTSWAGMKRLAGLRRKDEHEEEEDITEGQLSSQDSDEDTVLLVEEELEVKDRLKSLVSGITIPEIAPIIKGSMLQWQSKASGIRDKIKSRLSKEQKPEETSSDLD